MTITLLTDFGLQDTFVGVLKGVLRSIAPDARVVDLTHHVPPQDIRAGAFALQTAYSYFPPGTIHLAVVDPGVGGPRCPIAAHIGDFCYVCPDNGLLTYVLAQETLHQAVTLDNPQRHSPRVSRTFHGRDIFAPAAAHLANGLQLLSLGTPINILETLPHTRPEWTPAGILTRVIYIDFFGNVFLDMTEDMADIGEQYTITLNDTKFGGPLESYSAVPEREPLMLFGSSGHLEIAVRSGHAARRFRLRAGDTVLLRKTDQEAT